MYLTHLSLTHFRNFARLDVDVPRGTVLIVGDNAQGKTSLLEAVYFLSVLTSFHSESDRHLINFLAAREPLAVARIVADFQRNDGAHRMEVRIIQEPNGNGTRIRKEVLFDDLKRPVGKAVGEFKTVLFLPQMLRVVDGPPAERRRYLNLLLAQVWPGYAEALSRYTRQLQQRNALLKLLAERGRSADPQLDFWDGQLAESAATLIYARIQAVQGLERLAAPLHRDLTRGREVLRLDYRPAYDPLAPPNGQRTLPMHLPTDRTACTLEDIREGMVRALAARRPTELAAGVTTIGPHRDELRFLSNGVDVGIYGSRGQVRTVMLALKLAEVRWMTARAGQQPVVLLDEVLAELDAHRRADLLEQVLQGEQALLTTTDPDLFAPEFVAHTTRWHIREGRLEAVLQGEA